MDRGSVALVVVFSVFVAAAGTGQDAAPGGPVAEDVFERGLVSKATTLADMLEESTKYSNDTARKRFKGTVLGYVTPWNRNGYDAAVRWRAKFTHISPAWLALKGDKFGIRVEGTHEVDKTWMKQLRAKPVKLAPAIVPRIVFEVSAQVVDEFMSPGGMEDAITSLVQLCLNKKFDGLVLEAWGYWRYLGLLSIPSAREMLIGFVRKLAEALHSANWRKSGKPLELHFVLQPVDSGVVPGRLPEYFDAEDLLSLHEVVDGFSLMTYDFTPSHARDGVALSPPNSPLPWVRECLDKLLEWPASIFQKPEGVEAKVLMGLNFYGYRYLLQIRRAITAKDFRETLTELAGAASVTVDWLEEEAEHKIAVFDRSQNLQTIFYPTLMSIQVRLEEATRRGVGISIWELGQGMDYFYDLL